MDLFLEELNSQQSQESLYHQWIDECSNCSLERFQDILQALPTEWKLSAVHTAVRHFNRPALKWYLNHSSRGIPDILLYCCQLNYVELIMYLGQSIFKYQLQDLLTEDEKYSCIWWSFSSSKHKNNRSSYDLPSSQGFLRNIGQERYRAQILFLLFIFVTSYSKSTFRILLLIGNIATQLLRDISV
jgi:hypothetical protein